METGTLKELNVQPGDVVEYVPLGGRSTIGRVLNGRYYIEGGNGALNESGDWRIVSRANAPQPDLTAITTPYGLLDEATQQALRAHGGPYEVYMLWGSWSDASRCDVGSGYTVRVKPAPKRETVTRDWAISPEGMLHFSVMEPYEQPVRVTYETVDGKIDLSTYRLEDR